MANHSHTLLGAFCVCLLTACGGAGQDDSSTGDGDRAPPVSLVEPPPGAYGEAQTIALQCDDNGGSGCARIHYTMDGSEPSLDSPVYENPLAIEADTLVQFFAVDEDGNAEPVQRVNYIIDKSPPSTTTAPPEGPFNAPMAVSLECSDNVSEGCAAIYYTTDGSDPTTESARFQEPIPVAGDMELRFFAVDGFGNVEPVQTAAFTLDDQPPGAAADPAGGTFSQAFSLALNCDDSASGCAAIHYTVDGTTPTQASPLYEGPIVINQDTSVRFVAFDAAGNASAVNVADFLIRPVVAPLYPANGVQWNDYVRADGQSPLTASDAVCGNGDRCLHGGIMRVVAVPGVTDCQGLSAVDTLGAFNWHCDDQGDGVRMISTGLREGKYLSDLIDWDAAPLQWRDNAVTVSSGDGELLATQATPWWSNPISEVPDGGGNLEQDGILYAVATDVTGDYVVTGEGAGLVVKPGATVTGLGGSNVNPALKVSGRHHWVEGSFDAALSRSAIEWHADESVMHGVRVANAGPNTNKGAIFVNAADNNHLTDLRIANGQIPGLLLSDARDNVIAGVVSYNNAQAGVRLENDAMRNILVDVTSFNNEFGLVIGGRADSNFVSNVTAVNNARSGIAVIASPGQSADKNTLQNIAAVNNGEAGIHISGNAGHVDELAIINAAAAHNVVGIDIDQTILSNFRGMVRLGANEDDCLVDPDNPRPGMTPGCQSATPSDASVEDGISAAQAFVAAAADDAANRDAAAGVAVANAIGDWWGFDNPYRGWGADGAQAFPDLSQRGRCAGGDGCRIWDWRLSAAGGSTAWLSVLPEPSGNDVHRHRYEVASEGACEAIAGAQWNGAAATDERCQTQFLRNSVELLHDGIGNDNGLCESAERCLFTAHLGSYQGHGALISAGGFADGAVAGVTLLRHEENGAGQ